MKTKAFSLLVFLAFLATAALSQNDGKEGNEGCGNGCAGGCTGCGNAVFDFLFNRHTSILDKKGLDPRMTSIEFRAYYGLNSLDKQSFVTSMSARWGILSTELRLTNLSFGGNIIDDRYQLMEWQVLKLNLLYREVSRIWAGTGLMYEGLDDGYYHEHFLGLDFFFEDIFLYAEMDARVSYCFNKDFMVFHEENLRILLRIYESKRWYGFVSLGGLYQQYHGQGFWAGKAGIILNLHKAQPKKNNKP